MAKKDNRTFKRAGITLKIKVKESETDISVNFNIRDLSEGGIFVHSSLLWEPGQKFELSFNLPGTEHEIKASGEVARAEDKYFLIEDPDTDEPIPGMGIRFTKITAADKQLIKDYIASLNK